MHLDTKTLLFVMWLNATMMSAALWLGVGRSVRSGLRAWNASLLIQMVAWAMFIAGMRPVNKWLIVVSVGLLCGSLSAMYMTVQHFTRRPVSWSYVWGAPIAAAITHAMVFDDFATRVAHINLILCAQMLWLAWRLFQPGRHASGGRWRALAGGSFLLSGLFVLGRALLVIVAPERYPNFDEDHWLSVVGLLINNGSLTVGTLGFLLAHRDEAEQELKRMATTDALTGLHNRHWLEERGTDHLSLAQRYGQPLTVMMMDLDYFKRINDTHGHVIGDHVLQAFAQRLREVGRDADLIARYGGEEFCVLLPMSDPSAATELDQRLRQALADELPDELGFAVTYSAGIAQLEPGIQTLSELFARADRALYDAKHAGRNQTVVAPVLAMP
ncbi:MAG: GGDEF domain-containing protein [Acidobacteriota bacterium]